MTAEKKRKKTNKRAVVAMSGGVDSSVSAALLKKQGYDVIGVHMKFWHERRSSSVGKSGKGFNRCCTPDSEKIARLAAKKINIPFYVFNLEKEFKKRVVDYFLKEQKAGRTPNPCVVCNKEIKFGLLLERALKLGADFVATGHYARLRNTKKYEYTKIKNKKNSYIRKKATLRGIRFAYSVFRSLLQAKDKNKDQSYFLWQLSQEQLRHILFPLGGYTKTEVRKMAKKLKLPAAKAPESQEVCFVRTSTNDFLKKYLKPKPGGVASREGKVLGEHQGLCFYTIGQRKGIGLPGGPYYVLSKDPKKNILIISKNEKDLLQKELIVEDVHWIAGYKPKFPLRASVKIRYRAKPADAMIFKFKISNLKLLFDRGQKAVTPGQSAVFYSPLTNFEFKNDGEKTGLESNSKLVGGKGEELLGGGIIK